MSKTNLQVGDKIYVPISSNDLSEGVILDIDNDDIYDPRLKYKVCFDELDIITFLVKMLLEIGLIETII